jgi:hypothetical protein
MWTNGLIRGLEQLARCVLTRGKEDFVERRIAPRVMRPWRTRAPEAVARAYEVGALGGAFRPRVSANSNSWVKTRSLLPPRSRSR